MLEAEGRWCGVIGGPDSMPSPPRAHIDTLSHLRRYRLYILLTFHMLNVSIYLSGQKCLLYDLP